MHPSEPFPHVVDDYLGYLYEILPGRASLDGVHLHDDLLEDLSRPAIDAQVHALGAYGRRLDQINRDVLSPLERVEQQIVARSIEAKIFDLDVVRPWDRSPHVYASVVGTALASQAVFGHAPESDRAKRLVSKLRQIPRLVQAARDNIKESPGIFVKFGLEAWRGTLKFIEADLPRSFSGLDDLHILGDLADTSTDAAAAIKSYVEYLETEQAPRAKASFRLGREKFEERLKLEEGIAVSAERLLGVAMRELHGAQDEFRSVAGRLNKGDPGDAWREVNKQHPEPSQLLHTAEAQTAELAEFLQTQPVLSMPDSEPVVTAPTPSFHRWTSASMWTAGPFESRRERAYYYLTDVDRGWTPEQQKEHMRDFSHARLWNMSIHQVYPGHLVQAQRLRHVESKVRKSRLLAPRSFVEGWADYCEQMMSEAGFRRDDPLVKLGQIARAMVRLARLVVGVRLHCDDLSVEQGMRFFRDEAFLEEASARREAERGTFDPGYVTHAAGRLMMLKMRHDYKEQQGGKFSLRVFHDTVLGQGNAPFWAHRWLLFGEPSDVVLE